MKVSLSFFILFLVLAISIIPLVSAQTINAGANQNIINSQPPTAAPIISHGHGDVYLYGHYGSGYSCNYYDVDWALTSNDVIYVWNRNKEATQGTVVSLNFLPAIAGATIAIVIVGIVLIILLRRQR